MFGFFNVLRYHVRNSNSSKGTKLLSRLTNTKPKYILSNFATMTTKTRIVLNHSTHVDGLIVALTKNAALTASKGSSRENFKNKRWKCTTSNIDSIY
jgi:hypothetical protein